MRMGLLECREDTWEWNTLIRATEVKGVQEEANPGFPAICVSILRGWGSYY